VLGRMGKALLRPYKALPEGVRDAVWRLRSEITLARAARRSEKSLRGLRSRTGLKLHLGCGPDLKPGWVNIDLTPPLDREAFPDTVFLNYDLRADLPFDAGSCDAIYSSHFLEHLECRHGRRLLRECYRVLRPGGTFRAALPNFTGLFRAYALGDHAYFDLVRIQDVLPEFDPATAALVDHVNYAVYQNGEHKCIYDEEKVVLMLRALGYTTVRASSYQEGIDPSEEVRRRYSFYVEATK
jgi:predicted SAM-dependent methyltransferase